MSLHRSRRLLTWLLAGGVSLAALGWVNAERGGQAVAQARPAPAGVPVVTVSAVASDFSIYLDALGSVVPASSVLVKSQVDGPLLKVHFQEGELVEAGQLLAEIDPRPFQANLLQARGQLARDQALLKNAELDLQRYSALSARDAVPVQLLNAQEAQVQQYQGTVEISRGLVAQAELQLEHARITAPISGRTGLRLVDPGNLVRSGDAAGIVLISQLQPAHVLFTLAEDQLPTLLARHGQQARLQVELYDRSRRRLLAEGELLTLDNQIDTSTGTIRLKAQVDNLDGQLFANQFVNVRLRLDTLENAVSLPLDAVQRGTHGPFVYRVDEQQRVRIQPVGLGPEEGGRVLVRGLEAGQQVVLDGVDRLREGTQVVATPASTERTAGTGLSARLP